MRLWRLSSGRHSRDFDGGYGLFNDGRWNTRGHPVTYCSTVASLTVLEKRVHVNDPALLPPQFMVVYEVPDDVSARTINLEELPADWAERVTHTQAMGDQWLDSAGEALLFVPSVIMPITRIPDRNGLINHWVAQTASIKIAEVTPFNVDLRLFQPL